MNTRIEDIINKRKKEVECAGVARSNVLEILKNLGFIYDAREMFFRLPKKYGISLDKYFNIYIYKDYIDIKYLKITFPFTMEISNENVTSSEIERIFTEFINTIDCFDAEGDSNE